MEGENSRSIPFKKDTEREWSETQSHFNFAKLHRTYHLVTHFLTFMIKQQVWNFQNFPPFESILALNVRRKHKVMIQIIVAWHVKKAIGKVAKDATTTPLLKP